MSAIYEAVKAREDLDRIRRQLKATWKKFKKSIDKNPNDVKVPHQLMIDFYKKVDTIVTGRKYE